ncbi:MAG: ABC transporter permease [Christensenellaceae bacterium]|jgi:ABC-2 type transport system permease protein|nr:ABC transporter permease [Christensenellaceae bacterium]
MRSYLALFKMRFIAGLQYRAAAWAGIATQFFFGFLFLMIFRAFYRSSGMEPPMAWPQLASYVWLQQAFLAILMLWSQDNDLLLSVVNGDSAYELCRPYDLYAFWAFRLAATRLSAAALRFAPVLLVACLLPPEYRMALPPSLWAFALFLLSMALSLALVVALSMFVYILALVTLSSYGSRLAIGVTAELLMGAVVPIPLMPDWAQAIVNWFPFRYIMDLPFRLYSGHIAGAEAALQIGIQIAWVLGLAALGRLAFARTMRRIVIQGG